MKTASRFRWVCLTALVTFNHGPAAAQSEITYDVTGLVDVADLLIIRGSELQWHHPGSGAAVGRHSGRNEPTTITSTQDGVTNLDQFAWIPTWPEPPPAQIRYDAFSSVFSDLVPALPSGNTSVTASVLAGRGSVQVKQYPDATNDWTLIVRFADGVSGSAFLTTRVTIDYLRLHLVSLGSTRLQIRWPTNSASYQLESVAHLPALPGDWVVVTNAPAVIDQDFAVTLDWSAPQQFYRLHKL